MKALISDTCEALTGSANNVQLGDQLALGKA
ncbi:protein of unknown function [Moritella yayanosii]|uniref:Uncharacterized protein n=1 Tax=Moritella yayanosii TaxID=69539 RepID=A0A330LHU3_9GAMM|nr:protein of unknown function [Moritella yayanosii]